MARFGTDVTIEDYASGDVLLAEFVNSWQDEAVRNMAKELIQLRAENETLQDMCKLRGNAVEHLQGENARLREALTEISKDTMRVGFFNPYTKGAMIARAALEKHVREIDHINEISTPSTQAENVSKNSGEIEG